MKVYNEQNVAVLSTIKPIDVTKMTVDAEAMSHVMGMLSNIYTDPVRATLREIATNAYDSHLLAGQSLPVKVTLPTALNPVLTVEDHGVGMSRYDLGNTVCRYGASTKRDTDEQIGGFGIGIKSPFTIAAQFTITAVKNGTKVVAVFAVGSDGVPEMSILSETETTAPDGVKVSIPTNKCEEMARAADMFQWWPAGTVMVNGEFPSVALSNYNRMTDDLWHRPTQEWRGSVTALVGNISYPLNEQMVRKAIGHDYRPRTYLLEVIIRKYDMVLGINVGEVDVTPARESLRDTDRTIKAIAKRLADFVELATVDLLERIANAPTITHAAIIAGQETALLDYSKVIPVYDGENMKAYADLAGQMYTYSVPRTRINMRQINKVTLQWTSGHNKVAVITGVTDDNRWSVERVMRAFFENQEKTVEDVRERKSLVLLADKDKGEMGWFTWGGNSPVATYKATDVVATFKKERAPRGSGATKPVTYKVRYLRQTSREWGTDEYTVDEINSLNDENGVIVVLGNCRQTLDLVAKWNTDKDVYGIVLSDRQKEDVFKRRCPNIKELGDVATELLDKESKSYTKDEYAAAWFSHNQTFERLASIKGDLTCKNLVDKLDEYLRIKKLSEQMKSETKGAILALPSKLAPKAPEAPELLLLGAYMHHHQRATYEKHMVAYVNAICD